MTVSSYTLRSARPGLPRDRASRRATTPQSERPALVPKMDHVPYLPTVVRVRNRRMVWAAWVRA